MSRIIMLSFSILLFLIGCTATHPRNDTPFVQQSIELTIAYSTQGYLAHAHPWIHEYLLNRNDNLKLNWLEINGDKYAETLNMLFTTGQAPDLFVIPNEWLYSYLNKNWIHPLSETTVHHLREQFPPWAVEYGDYNGKSYTVMSTVQTFRLLYNRTLFKTAGLNPDNPPQTWDELYQAAKAISQSRIGFRQYGFVWPGGDPWKAFVQNLEAPATQDSGYFYNHDSRKFDFTTYASWFHMLDEMRKNGILYPGENVLKYDMARMQFALGNIGSMILSSSDYYWIHNANPELDFGITYPPVHGNPLAIQHLMMGSETPIAISTQTKNPELAEQLFLHMQSDEVLGYLFESDMSIPVSNVHLEKYKLLDKSHPMYWFLPLERDVSVPSEPKLFISNIPYISEEIIGLHRFETYRSIIDQAEHAEERLQTLTDQFNELMQHRQTGP